MVIYDVFNDAAQFPCGRDKNYIYGELFMPVVCIS
jgi:hypothetical protein